MSTGEKYFADRLEAKIRELQQKLCGRDYVGACFAKFTQTSDINGRVRAWLLDPKNVLVWTGAPGTGKTYFKACMIGWVLERSFPWNSKPMFSCYRFWTEREFIQRVKDSFDLKGDDNQAVKLLTDAEFLFFDDLGSTGEGTSDWKKKIIYEFADERFSCGWPTIITTNLTKQQIANAYDPRVADRIFAQRNTIIDTHDQESKR